jgi:mannose/fructose/N-acetylgalactosamine-specific phosphotransferase system component IIB
MPIVLFRVDERLIHGQVVVGWGERLEMDRFIVVDDELFASAWEQELYCLGVPAAVDAIFVDVEQARAALPGWAADPRRVVVLVRNVDTLARLAAGGTLDGLEINLGGIHHSPGRERLLPYLYLNRLEREKLRDVAAAGARVSARDLPSSRAIPLETLLQTP